MCQFKMEIQQKIVKNKQKIKQKLYNSDKVFKKIREIVDKPG